MSTRASSPAQSEVDEPQRKKTFAEVAAATKFTPLALQVRTFSVNSALGKIAVAADLCSAEKKASGKYIVPAGTQIAGFTFFPGMKFPYNKACDAIWNAVPSYIRTAMNRANRVMLTNDVVGQSTVVVLIDVQKENQKTLLLERVAWMDDEGESLPAEELQALESLAQVGTASRKWIVQADRVTDHVDVKSRSQLSFFGRTGAGQVVAELDEAPTAKGVIAAPLDVVTCDDTCRGMTIKCEGDAFAVAQKLYAHGYYAYCPSDHAVRIFHPKNMAIGRDDIVKLIPTGYITINEGFYDPRPKEKKVIRPKAKAAEPLTANTDQYELLVCARAEWHKDVPKVIAQSLGVEIVAQRLDNFVIRCRSQDQWLRLGNKSHPLFAIRFVDEWGAPIPAPKPAVAEEDEEAAEEQAEED